MAEIRINTTGGLKLYDADNSHYAQIVAGTITSNVDAITLGHDTVTIADNLSLGSDSAILKFGADTEIALTHVADTGLKLTDSGGTPTLQLHDANESIASDGSKVIITSGGTAFSLPTSDGSNGQALVTNGSAVLSFATVSAADPSSADGDSLGTASAEWSDLYLADGGIIYFGNDQDVTLTHDPDDGLFLKSIATGDDNPVLLTLQTGETDIAASDVIGAINFQAPDEGTGTDAILVAAGIEAVSEGDFSSSNNATKLSFKTAASEAAAEKMSLSSTGVLTTSGDIVAASGSVRNRPNVEPLIVNGDMSVAQRSQSVTGIGNGDSGYHTVDRFRYQEGATPGAVWTMAQDEIDASDGGNAWALGGHTRALKISCTTADSSLDSGITETIETYLEKQNLKLFRKGSSGAQKFTLAFWIYATKTGTHICELQDQSNDRAVSAAYTVSSSNTWEHKVVSFPADTTGAWTPNNQLGLKIRWYLTAGSDYQASALQTAWAASATGKRANGQVNNADSTSNVWMLTGAQLEVGEYDSDTVPSFQHESYGENLHRCARYFWYTGNGSVYQHHGTGVEASATAAYLNIPLITSLRTSPTVTAESIGSLVVWDGGGERTITSLGNTYYSSYGAMVNQAVTCSGGGVVNSAGVTVYSSNDATSGFYLDAELS